MRSISQDLADVCRVRVIAPEDYDRMINALKAIAEHDEHKNYKGAYLWLKEIARKALSQ